MDRERLAALGPLYRGLGRWPRDIRVCLSYERTMPVVTAWSLERSEEATGTTAIDILRRHLERCLAGGPYMVDVLEPSPFPADLRIAPRPAGAADEQLVSVSMRVQPGFDVIDIGVDTEDASFEAMVDHALYQARLEADDYYAVMLGMDETERLWDTAVDRFDAFIAGERARTGWLRGEGAQQRRRFAVGPYCRALRTPADVPLRRIHADDRFPRRPPRPPQRRPDRHHLRRHWRPDRQFVRTVLLTGVRHGQFAHIKSRRPREGGDPYAQA
jgi:hypothetical protein